MTAIAQMLSRVLVTVGEVELLKQFVLAGAAGLFVWLLMQTYGLDLSPGLF